VSTASEVIVADVDNAGQGDLRVAIEEMNGACDAYDVAESMFNGKRAERYASTRLRRVVEATGLDFSFRFASIPVTAVSNRLKIAGITADTTEATAAWDTVWKANKLKLEYPHILSRSLEYGDGYVMVWPRPAEDLAADDTTDDEDTDELAVDDDEDFDDQLHDDTPPAFDVVAPEDVEVYWNDPRTCRVFYDPERPTRKAFVARRWTLPSHKRVRIDLLYRNRIVRYIGPAGVTSPKAEQMKPYDGDGQPPVLRNPFGRLPVFHFRFGSRPYGLPEHAGFYAAQDIITKLIVSHFASIDFSVMPQRYALMDGDADTSELAEDDLDDFASFDPAPSRTKPDEASSLSREPGALWLLRGMRGTGEFSTADPSKFLDPAEVYLRWGAQLTNTPLRLFEQGASQLPSGESQKQVDGPFVEKVGIRQAEAEDTLQELAEFVLLLCGHPGAQVTVRWKPIAIIADLTGWQIIQTKLAAGLPPRVAFLEAGYDEDEVLAWFPDEDEDDLPGRLQLLERVAGALQKLGAVVALGFIQQEDLMGLVKTLLGDSTLLDNLSPAPPVPSPPAPVASPKPPAAPPAPVPGGEAR